MSLRQTINKINRTIDDSFALSDEEILALVKKAYLRTAKICSRGPDSEYLSAKIKAFRNSHEIAPIGPFRINYKKSEHYAGATTVLYEAFGEDILDQLGASPDWQLGFLQGFEHFESFQQAPQGSSDFNEGFRVGRYVANQVFHHWPESPTVDSVPEL